VGTMKPIQIGPEDKITDLICKDTQCSECGGHAVQIFPRSKYNILWPALCLFCGQIGLANTGARSQDVIEHTYQRYQWAIDMTEIFAYHLTRCDTLDYFRYRIEGIDLV
jgi:hypothetical protein